MQYLNHRYVALREFLLSWGPLWGRSVFQDFAETESRVPESWFAFGRFETFTSQYAAGQGQCQARAPEDLSGWIARLRSLCALPGISASSPLQKPFEQGLTPKKAHEIGSVLGFLQFEAAGASRFLDIGGGAGHLARHLAHAFDCPVGSIDRDPLLQAKGRRIQDRSPWRDSLAHPVHFISGEFPAVDGGRVAGERAWAIGLHTCGGLAWAQLELVRRGYSVLNFGCCYERLTLGSETQRSRFAQQLPLPWTREALFLANRGGIERTLDEFLFQQRVQQHRFSLFKLLQREGAGRAQCEAVGSATPGAYQGAFSDYVRDRLAHLEGVPASLNRLSDGAIEDFYRDLAPQVEKLRFAAFLRNLLARPLELALLLDRALFVEEGPGARELSVRLIEFFDPKISPRNIGLVVSRKG